MCMQHIPSLVDERVILHPSSPASPSPSIFSIFSSFSSSSSSSSPACPSHLLLAMLIAPCFAVAVVQCQPLMIAFCIVSLRGPVAVSGGGKPRQSRHPNVTATERGRSLNPLSLHKCPICVALQWPRSQMLARCWPKVGCARLFDSFQLHSA